MPGKDDEHGQLCHVCGDWEHAEEMLLCDGCDSGFHLFCLEPPLSKVPDGQWLCPYCEQERSCAGPIKIKLKLVRPNVPQKIITEQQKQSVITLRVKRGEKNGSEGSNVSPADQACSTQEKSAPCNQPDAVSTSSSIVTMSLENEHPHAGCHADEGTMQAAAIRVASNNNDVEDNVCTAAHCEPCLLKEADGPATGNAEEPISAVSVDLVPTSGLSYMYEEEVMTKRIELAPMAIRPRTNPLKEEPATISAIVDKLWTKPLVVSSFPVDDESDIKRFLAQRARDVTLDMTKAKLQDDGLCTVMEELGQSGDAFLSAHLTLWQDETGRWVVENSTAQDEFDVGKKIPLQIGFFLKRGLAGMAATEQLLSLSSKVEGIAAESTEDAELSGDVKEDTLPSSPDKLEVNAIALNATEAAVADAVDDQAQTLIVDNGRFSDVVESVLDEAEEALRELQAEGDVPMLDASITTSKVTENSVVQSNSDATEPGVAPTIAEEERETMIDMSGESHKSLEVPPNRSESDQGEIDCRAIVAEEERETEVEMTQGCNKSIEGPSSQSRADQGEADDASIVVDEMKGTAVEVTQESNVRIQNPNNESKPDAGGIDDCATVAEKSEELDKLSQSSNGNFEDSRSESSAKLDDVDKTVTGTKNERGPAGEGMERLGGLDPPTKVTCGEAHALEPSACSAEQAALANEIMRNATGNGIVELCAADAGTASLTGIPADHNFSRQQDIVNGSVEAVAIPDKDSSNARLQEAEIPVRNSDEVTRPETSKEDDCKADAMPESAAAASIQAPDVRAEAIVAVSSTGADIITSKNDDAAEKPEQKELPTGHQGLLLFFEQIPDSTGKVGKEGRPLKVEADDWYTMMLFKRPPPTLPEALTASATAVIAEIENEQLLKATVDPTLVGTKGLIASEMVMSITASERKQNDTAPSMRKKKAERKDKGIRSKRCGQCAGCLVKDICGECPACKVKVKFGGDGRTRRGCFKRRCSNLIRPEGAVKRPRMAFKRSLGGDEPSTPVRTKKRPPRENSVSPAATTKRRSLTATTAISNNPGSLQMGRKIMVSNVRMDLYLPRWFWKSTEATDECKSFLTSLVFAIERQVLKFIDESNKRGRRRCPFRLSVMRDAFDFEPLGIIVKPNEGTNFQDRIDWCVHRSEVTPDMLRTNKLKPHDSDSDLLQLGCSTYVDVLDDATLQSVEEESMRVFDQSRKQTQLRPETYHHSFVGRASGDNASVTRTKMFFGARYLWTAEQLSESSAKRALGIRTDVNRPPKFATDVVLPAVVRCGALPEGMIINQVAMNIYHTGTTGIAPHFDDNARFDLPVISLRVFSDSRLSFGCRGSWGIGNGEFAIPMPRGSILVLHDDSYASDVVKHCVRPVDMIGRSGVLLFRKIHENLLREALEIEAEDLRDRFERVDLGMNVKRGVEACVEDLVSRVVVELMDDKCIATGKETAEAITLTPSEAMLNLGPSFQEAVETVVSGPEENEDSLVTMSASPARCLPLENVSETESSISGQEKDEGVTVVASTPSAICLEEVSKDGSSVSSAESSAESIVVEQSAQVVVAGS